MTNPDAKVVARLLRVMRVEADLRQADVASALGVPQSYVSKCESGEHRVDIVEIFRMFSFVGDTVLDSFLGTGTTSVAAARAGRNSVGVEVDEKYLEMARRRFLSETGGLFARAELKVS